MDFSSCVQKENGLTVGLMKTGLLGRRAGDGCRKSRVSEGLAMACGPPGKEVGQDSRSWEKGSKVRVESHVAPESQGVTPSLGAQRTYFGPARELREWRLQEEGGHDEVGFWDVNVVGQKVAQDPEPGKQAGALVRRRRGALQVIYRSGRGTKHD